MEEILERLDLQGRRPDELRDGSRAQLEILAELPVNGDARIREEIVGAICRALKGAGLGIRHSTGMKPDEITALFSPHVMAA